MSLKNNEDPLKFRELVKTSEKGFSSEAQREYYEVRYMGAT